MKYTVIKHFTDLQDGKYKYSDGDVYPREGYTPSEERIAELAGNKNRQKTPLIKAETTETVAEVTEDPKPKKRGRKKAE